MSPEAIPTRHRNRRLALLFTVALLAGCGDPLPMQDAPLPEHIAGSILDDPRAELTDGEGHAHPIVTFAGTGTPGWNGDGLGPHEIRLYWPMDVTVASNGTIYVMDWNNHRVLRMYRGGVLEAVIGDVIPGDGPPGHPDWNPPGVQGELVLLNHPTSMVERSDGTFLLASWHNHKIRHYDPATGLVYIFAGSSAGFSGDGQTVDQMRLSQPPSIVEAADGSIYIMDQRNQRIRKIDAGGIVSTVVGNPTDGNGDGWPDPDFGGDGGPPALALIGQPGGGNPRPGGSLALDHQGRLYFADMLNHRVRRVDFAANRIETVVGNGVPAYAGDGGPGPAASLNGPRDLQFDRWGRLYISDELNHAVRVWDPATDVITTVAGNGTQGFSGDGGPATEAQLYRPAGLAIDADDRLYIADSYNHRIRQVRLRR